MEAPRDRRSCSLKLKGASVPKVPFSKSRPQFRGPSVIKIHFQSVSSENTAQPSTGHKEGGIEEQKIPINSILIVKISSVEDLSTGLVKKYKALFPPTAVLELTQTDKKPGNIHSTGGRTTVVLVIKQLQPETPEQHDTAFSAYSSKSSSFQSALLWG